jgi:hypothetical protein
MTRYHDGPRSLGESLRDLASRYKKVDLLVIDEIRDRWDAVLGETLAAKCVPTIVRDGVLVIEVPSGAFAQRIRSEESHILAALSELGERAPKSLRVTVKSPG